MSEGWKLKRTTQCAGCPWRAATNPRSIPNGYSRAQHEALKGTIAGDIASQISRLGEPLRVMACHETHDAHCVGWVVHQLGPGNNIALRLRMANCTNLNRLRLRGEQHREFADTLPAWREGDA